MWMPQVVNHVCQCIRRGCFVSFQGDNVSIAAPVREVDVKYYLTPWQIAHPDEIKHHSGRDLLAADKSCILRVDFVREVL